MDPSVNQKVPNRSPVLSVRTLTQGLFLLLLVGLCIANGLLIKQNRDLKAFIASNQPEFLKPGQQVPLLAANTLSGQRQAVNYTARAKTVLLVFTPGCAACERTVPYWREIRAASIRDQYQIFGISLGDGLKSNSFLTSNGLSLDTLVDIDVETRGAYKLSLTPLTIVIDNHGKVEKIWPGAFNQQSKQEVEKYFGFSVVDDVK
ncbi:MAG: TlpA family protein disulfide reductase [Pyrinomonadaceae bacterium]|nr:TlpA family protein disulfide reductase [Pyrinomonadaceae bacterium]